MGKSWRCLFKKPGAFIFLVSLIISLPTRGQSCSDYDDHASCKPLEEVEVFSAAKISIFDKIDRFHDKQELTKERKLLPLTLAPNSTEVYADQCDPDLRDMNPQSFSDQINHFIGQSMLPQSISDSDFAESYNVNKDPKKIVPVSLISNPLCDGTVAGKTQTEEQKFLVFRKSLDATLGTRNNPDVESIKSAFLFAQKYNQARNDLLGANKLINNARKAAEAHKKVKQLMGAFMGCLAYEESLGDPDTKTSTNAYNENLPKTPNLKNPEKPNGVKTYIDTAQSNKLSRLNLGLYQFSPGSGNINACIADWNKKYAHKQSSSEGVILDKASNPVKDEKGNFVIKREVRRCFIERIVEKALIRPKKATNDAFKFLTSGQQSFNAFCGVNKILQNFHVQVNSSVATVSKGRILRSSPENVDPKGKFAAPKDRCVSPFFTNNFTYNHFGPLQNSTGKNFKQLMTCVDTVTKGI